VVGTDGSESSLRAVDRAGEIAADSNATLIIATGTSRSARICTRRTSSEKRATRCTATRRSMRSCARPATARRLPGEEH
jgi:hypothetical protein